MNEAGTIHPGLPFWPLVEAHTTREDVGTIHGVGIDRYDWLRIYPSHPVVESAVMKACLSPEGLPTHFVTIQGRRCKTLDEFVRTWGDALEFPGYYGRNIDAFNECLMDLLNVEEGGLGSQFRDRVGRPVSRLVINVADADLVLSQEDGRIGAPRILEIIDGSFAEVSGLRCDLRVVYYSRIGTSPEQLLSRLRTIPPASG
ncbi:barstar family protein [Rhodococcus opacus]|uniref:barstar family protein n=1 Tax=Rhodococcus opacus TaxID=37919 RepID=UPI0007CD5800|nr:barstar family protein [Rhodococcus opacus]MDX5962385.1 barstar family protein [Rhodococcus opacus]MDX5962789.1 barstar family protein [Rhodococcus opacus]MDX5969713.1 barstar family protein [Rhodococcus opacus]NKY70024.1 hypothetical protein [Rhodococcus opacus]CAG7597326.1 hypothetical protein E143388_04578 [Rhodococcus opacus]